MEVKIAVIGDDRTGKTAFCTRLSKGTPDFPLYLPTSEVKTYQRPVRVEQYGLINLTFFDVAAVASLDPIRPYYVQQAQVVILFFDLTNSKSLDRCVAYLKDKKLFPEQSKQHRLLIGSKADLAQQIDEQAIIEVAQQFKLQVFKVSARQKTGLEAVIDWLVSMAKAILQPLIAKVPGWSNELSQDQLYLKRAHKVYDHIWQDDADPLENIRSCLQYYAKDNGCLLFFSGGCMRHHTSFASELIKSIDEGKLTDLEEIIAMIDRQPKNRGGDFSLLARFVKDKLSIIHEGAEDYLSTFCCCL
jgi:small GTP-binding protein